MKNLKIALVLSCSFLFFNATSVSGFGKKHRNQIRYTLDTLSNKNDSVLIKISNYINDNIYSEVTAFYFDECNRVSFSRLPILRDFRVRQFAYWLVNHGKGIYHDPNGKKMVVHYNYGKEITTEYLDSLGHKISKEEYIGNRVFVHFWPIATGQRVFIPGNKKCQKRNKKDR